MPNFLWLLSIIIFKLQILSISKNIWNITDPVLSAINMFQDHPSIKNIRAKNFTSAFFSYTNQRNIRGVNVHKRNQLRDIPNKIIKMNVDVFASYICLHFNYCLYVLIMPRSCFRINPHSLVAWMSRTSSLETGAISEV